MKINRVLLIARIALKVLQDLMDMIVRTLTNVNSILMIAMLLFSVKIPSVGTFYHIFSMINDYSKEVINVMVVNLVTLELVNRVPTKMNALDLFVTNLKIPIVSIP